MRGAIWSMHCIAMRAVDFPTRVSAHLIETIASICSAIIAARRRPLSHQHTSLKNWYVCVGGVCMGPGSAAMHDLGMRAVRGCGHALRLVAACVSIVGASIAARCFAFYKRGVFTTLPGAIVHGLAIASMHVTAMAATCCVALGASVGLSATMVTQSCWPT